MSKLLKAFLVVALLWVLLIGGGFLTFRHMLSFIPQIIQVTEQESRDEVMTQAATGVRSLVVATRNGTVSVIGAETSEITIKAYYSARGDSRSSAASKLAQLSTDTALQGGALSINAVFPSLTVNNESIRYEITAPKDLDVRVNTSNGRISIEEVRGKVDLTTSNGTVDVVSDEGPKELLIRTSNGRINVKAAPTSGKYDLRTSNGTVTVALPETLGVSVKANTSNGSVNVDYGQWSFAGGQVSNRSFNATLGDGSLELDINTSNGNVKLEKR